MCSLFEIKNYQYIIHYENKILIIGFKHFIVKKDEILDENLNSKFSLNVSFFYFNFVSILL